MDFARKTSYNGEEYCIREDIMIFTALKDREFWHRVATDAHYAQLLEATRALWDSTHSDPITVLPLEDRMLFYRTGDRRIFEKPYFNRRNSLSAAALLLLVTQEEEYLAYVQRMLWAICDEYSWAVPAHTKGDPETDPFEIDLFNAETAFALAEILFVLEDRLDACVRERVRAEIKRRIFDPFLSRVQWYEQLDSNWAAVCAGNVGGAMLYLDPALFERCLPRLLHSMKLFLGGFSEEGICMEGTVYWTYGFSNFAWFSDLLAAHTNGRIDLLDDPRAELIATYMQKSFLAGNTTVSYSDGSRAGRVFDSLQYFLACRYPSSVHLLPREVCIPVSGNVKWANLVRAFVYLPPADAERHLPQENYDFPSAGQAIVNEKRYSLFVKAGHNQEQHNHNDVGSFILSTDAGQIFCDLGAGLYTKQYFRNETRYEILCNSSLGHSVPIVDGHPQKFGREYAGTLTHTGNVITVEMAGAYGQESLTRLTRTLTHAELGVRLCDRFEGDARMTERFVTAWEPRVENGWVRVGNVRLFFNSDICSLNVRRELHKTHTDAEETVYCLDFEILPGAREACFDFLVERSLEKI